MLSKIIDNIFFMWYISAVKTLHKRMWWNGRHACLRGKWEIVWVQVPPSAPNANCRAFSSIFCLYKKCSALMPAICLLPTKREIVHNFGRYSHAKLLLRRYTIWLTFCKLYSITNLKGKRWHRVKVIEILF